MIDQIAMIVDEGDQGSSYVENAIDRAKEREATLHGLYVIDAWRFGEYTVYGWGVLEREKQEQKGERTLKEIGGECEERDVEFRQETTVGKPDDTIRNYVRDNDIDLLVFRESEGEGRTLNSPQLIKKLQKDLTIEIETI
jgi:nucleotide-binding universal stress UspA family protein